MPIKVFQINDYDWCAGDCTKEEILSFYMAELDVDHEEATGDESEYPYELTDEEMDKTKFRTGDNNDEEISFREQLEEMVRRGDKFPCFFASED